MTSIVSDPSSLTKDKLKNELIKHNITLPSSDARKNVYVELYRKHFLQRKHSEFSSDEETSPVGVSKQKKTVKVRRSLSPRKPSKQKKMATDVAQFTDDELAARLREFGVDVGPILDSTRKVYQRKLAALLSGKVKAEPIATNDNEFSASDEDVEDSQDTEIIEEGGQDKVTERLAEYRANKQEGNRTTYRTVTSTTVTSRRGIRQDRRYEHDDWRQTSLKSVDNASSTSQQEGEPPAKPAKRWLSIKVQIIILIIVAIFIFLVVQNMDPAPKNPVSGKLENKQ